MKYLIYSLSLFSFLCGTSTIAGVHEDNLREELKDDPKGLQVIQRVLDASSEDHAIYACSKLKFEGFNMKNPDEEGQVCRIYHALEDYLQKIYDERYKAQSAVVDKNNLFNDIYQRVVDGCKYTSNAKNKLEKHWSQAYM